MPKLAKRTGGQQEETTNQENRPPGLLAKVAHATVKRKQPAQELPPRVVGLLVAVADKKATVSVGLSDTAFCSEECPGNQNKVASLHQK